MDEDARPAFAVEAGPADPGEGPPLEELEALMGGEIAARDGGAAVGPAPRRTADAEEEDTGKTATLPELDALVARLPAELRETLDELFRARFVSVKKLPKKNFLAASAKARSDAS